MSLLYDANLSPRLVERLAKDFPGSQHVEVVGLRSTDDTIWQYALERAMTVVTKDNDFIDRAALTGPPGKVVVLTLGNCRTALVEDVMRGNAMKIREFISNPTESIMFLP